MGKILTAEEFLIINDDKDFRLSMSGRYVSEMMVAFAKVHVEKALKAKIEAMREYFEDGGYSLSEIDAFTQNSYPLTNIK